MSHTPAHGPTMSPESRVCPQCNKIQPIAAFIQRTYMGPGCPELQEVYMYCKDCRDRAEGLCLTTPSCPTTRQAAQ